MTRGQCWIAPSILAADFSRLAEEIEKVPEAQWIHIDVMDGHFVPNLTIGAPVVKSLRKNSKRFLDCHLMVEDPASYFETFVRAGADQITFHAEAVVPLRRMEKSIEILKQYKVKRGIALSPDSNLDMIRDYLDDFDMVLFMSVYPGFGGQKFIRRVLPKVRELRKLKGDDFLIQIDGGIDKGSIREAFDAGVNVFVAGSAVFGKENPARAFSELLELLK
jgi:ribulose-phosphate 3-epimerase